VSPTSFMDAAQNTYESALDGCGDAIQDAFTTMFNLSATEAGRKNFTASFKLCGPLQSQSDALQVIQWVQDGFTGMAMLDYPFPSDYGISLPAWPVNTTCKTLVGEIKKGKPVVEAVALAIGTIFNNTGNHTCYNITTDIPDWGGCCGWDYLACTEVYLPEGTSKGSIWPYQPWNYTADNDACESFFNVGIRGDWPVIQWGNLYNLNAQDGSNIIFSNGLLDPWHTSGILTNKSDSLIAIVIAESAHHLDLWAPTPEDPIYVTEARHHEADIISGWLSDYWHALENQ